MGHKSSFFGKVETEIGAPDFAWLTRLSNQEQIVNRVLRSETVSNIETKSWNELRLRERVQVSTPDYETGF